MVHPGEPLIVIEEAKGFKLWLYVSRTVRPPGCEPLRLSLAKITDQLNHRSAGREVHKSVAVVGWWLYVLGNGDNSNAD
jgi:hypothetical protein